jgi:hypothetical protein
MREYSITINRLADELGIPLEHVNYAMDYFDKNVVSIDSLFKVSCELFEITDSYLNNHNRQSVSSLIILGGWIEALYITCNLEKDASQDIMQRIGRQKYSLNSIISLLKMYEEDLEITNYLVMLDQLKKKYEGVEIYYQNMEDIRIDTINKQIATDNAEVKISVSRFNTIRADVNKIRSYMTE